MRDDEDEGTPLDDADVGELSGGSLPPPDGGDADADRAILW